MMSWDVRAMYRLMLKLNGRIIQEAVYDNIYSYVVEFDEVRKRSVDRVATQYIILKPREE